MLVRESEIEHDKSSEEENMSEEEDTSESEKETSVEDEMTLETYEVISQTKKNNINIRGLTLRDFNHK